MQTEHLSIDGMNCSGCVNSVSQALRAIRGVRRVNVSLTLRSAAVQFDERLTSADELVQAVERAGYGRSEGDTGTGHAPHGRHCCCS